MPSSCSSGEGTQRHDVQPINTSRRGLSLEAVCYVQPSTHSLLRGKVLYLHQWTRTGQSCTQLPPLGRWCSMSSPEVALWWDSDADCAGRPLRPDVRAAAHGIWGSACRQARSLISDSSQAADIMESTVTQVSRYLDRGCVAVFSQQIDGLMMLAFQRSLYRYVAKLRRVENCGGTGEISNRVVDQTWAHQVHVHLQLDQVVRLLCERSRTILSLRYAGYTWKESAQVLGVSVPALRSAFWRCSPSEKRTEERSLRGLRARSNGTLPRRTNHDASHAEVAGLSSYCSSSMSDCGNPPICSSYAALSFLLSLTARSSAWLGGNTKSFTKLSLSIFSLCPTTSLLCVLQNSAKSSASMISLCNFPVFMTRHFNQPSVIHR